MYMTRLEFTVPTTRAVELQREHDFRTEVLSTQQGFLGSLLLNSLGYPVMHVSPMYYHTTKYILLTQWESPQAADAWTYSPRWQAFVQAHPSETLFAPTAPVKTYELVQHLTATGQAHFAWLVDIEADALPEGPSIDERALTALCERYQARLEPFVESRLFRECESADRFLLALLLKGETEFPLGQEIPDLREFYQAHLPDGSASSRLVPEGFEVVHLL